jgi:predicted XRE-type DNA-binding protein
MSNYIFSYNYYRIIIIIQGGIELAKMNMEIRKATKDAGFRMWEVADAYGITDSSFSRMLRKELPPEKKAIIINTIRRMQERRA